MKLILTGLGILVALVIVLGMIVFMFPSGNAEKGKPQFTIVQLTDIHYTSTPPETSGLSWKHHIRILGYKLHKNNLAEGSRILHNTIEYINEKIKPDLVVITGDMVDRVDDRESMKQVKAILDKLNSPYYPVMGDREFNIGPDRRRDFKEIFGGVNSSFDHKGWHLIMLGVYPDDRDLDWLKEVLDRNEDKPTMLFTHQMLTASWLMRKLARRFLGVRLVCPRAEEIVEILNNHGNVIATFSGHSHTNYSRKKGGILYISTAALIGPPYQFRVINVYKDRISTSVRTAHPLKKR